MYHHEHQDGAAHRRNHFNRAVTVIVLLGVLYWRKVSILLGNALFFAVYLVIRANKKAALQ